MLHAYQSSYTATGDIMGLSDDDNVPSPDEIVLLVSITDPEHLASLLKTYPSGKKREYVRSEYLRLGGDAAMLAKALTILRDEEARAATAASRRRTATIWGILATASGAASAYHGYRRNDSVGWALWWFLMGSMFPVITPTIAVAQGFGKPR